jgi:glutamate receptor ionotropic, NMDA 1
VELVIEFEPGLDSFAEQLQELKGAQARVYLLFAGCVFYTIHSFFLFKKIACYELTNFHSFKNREHDAEVIFREAASLNMTEAGHVWILTEQALAANNVPEGALALRLKNATNEVEHIQDSM